MTAGVLFSDQQTIGKKKGADDMKKWFFPGLLGITLLLCGCAMRTAEEMYVLPRRSQEYAQLQTAIDSAMYGLTFSAPQSGDNQQTVQMADLDGDGEEEYLVFAKGATEKPLQILIFKERSDGSVYTMETIGTNGQAFEQVEYVDFDDEPGLELVIGQQLSNQILRSVAVYSFSDGDAKLLLMNSYSKFLTCDLDQNGLSELLVIRPGEAESKNGLAVLYASINGDIYRSVETEMSSYPSQIRRIMPSVLQGGTPAVYVASAVENDTIVTDVLAMQSGKFTNIALKSESDIRIRTLNNYYIYPVDINEDNILELPALMTMKPVSLWSDEDQKYLLRWFSLDENGWEVDKCFTYHNFSGGWYLVLGDSWASRVSVEQGDNVFTFYLWDTSYQGFEILFQISVLTGSDRDKEATENGRFPLYRTEGVAYAAKLETGAANYNITEESLVNAFHRIRDDWQIAEN